MFTSPMRSVEEPTLWTCDGCREHVAVVVAVDHEERTTLQLCSACACFEVKKSPHVELYTL